MKGRTTSNFSVDLGPGGAHQVSFLFHCNTWTDIFFYRHKLLTFSEREITASQITEAACHLSKIGRPRFALEISWGSSWARACNILLGGTRLDLGHLHKPGPMWSSPGLSSQGWRVGDGAGWMPIGSSRINQTVHKYDRPWPLLLREASLFDVTFSL